MKKVLILVLVLLLALIGAWYFGLFTKKDDAPSAKPSGLSVSEHTESFNQSVNRAMDAYYRLTEAFVNWDTGKVNINLAEFRSAVDNIRIQEMEKDSAIYPTVQSQWEGIKAEIAGMQVDTSLKERREDLNSLSQQLYDLLRIVKYDAAKVYYQECPMALNNYESSAFWLSADGETKKRRNPYLGLHDPKYGRSMLTCGTTRDSINFAKTATEN
jgi:flagellar basal body-associated protein FliL